ncbi:MAG: hypothetical protein ACYCSQ_05975 [bacterium]
MKEKFTTKKRLTAGKIVFRKNIQKNLKVFPEIYRPVISGIGVQLKTEILSSFERNRCPVRNGIYKYMDNSIAFKYNGVSLEYKEIIKRPVRVEEKIVKIRKKYIPPADHPWRKTFKEYFQPKI